MKIGDENKQTKEYIFFSGTKVRILFEYNYFYWFIYGLFGVKRPANKKVIYSDETYPYKQGLFSPCWLIEPEKAGISLHKDGALTSG